MEQIEQEQPVKKRAPRKKKEAIPVHVTNDSPSLETVGMTKEQAESNGGQVTEFSVENNKAQFEEAVAKLEDPAEVLSRYLNDEVVVRNVLSWAEALEKQFGKKWFTVIEACRNRRVEASQLGQILQIMILKGQAHRRSYGPPGNEMIKYKVTLLLSDKVMLLKDEVADYERRIEAIKGQITLYEKELKERPDTTPFP